MGISGEDEEKQQHFCHCSSPFYSAACVGSLLSVAMFGCIFSMVRILTIIAFTRLFFQTLAKRKFGLGLLYTKLKNTTEASILLSVIAMNIDRLATMFVRLIWILMFRNPGLQLWGC